MERKYPPPFLRRIQTKLLVPITLSLFLVMLISSIFLYKFISSEETQETRADVKGLVRVIRDSVEEDLSAGRPERVKAAVERLGRLHNVKGIHVLDASGVVVFSSDPRMARRRFSKRDAACAECHRMPRAARPATLEVSAPNPLRSFARTMVALPGMKACPDCPPGSKTHARILVVDISTRLYQRLLHSLRRHILFVMAAGFIVLLCTVILASRRMITRPVSCIIEGIRAAGAGDFSRPVEVSGDDEIALLGGAFNRMRADITQNLKDIRLRDSHIEDLDALRRNLQTINQSLNRRILELISLNKIGAAVTATLEIQELFDIVTESIRSTLDIDNFCLFLFNEETERLEVKAYSGISQEAAKHLTFHRGQGVTGSVLETRRPRIIGNVAREPDFIPYDGITSVIRSLLVVPLLVRDRAIGVLHINSNRENAFSPYDLAFFTAVANQLAIAIDNAKLYQMQRELAVTDSLTGVCNHGCFQNRLGDEVERTQRYGHTLALLMLDIDLFKVVNDQYGHASGDQVLRAISRILKAQTRNVDTVARYGGEEFSAILPETTLENARIVAERIRKEIAATPISIHGRSDVIFVTVSIGVAAFNGVGDTKGALIDRADQALYHSKSQGRNQVTVATG